MQHIATLTFALVALSLAGCGTAGPTYTNEDFKRASKYCYDEAYKDQSARLPDWFTLYLDCSRERVMPVEIYAHRKEAEARAIYDEMYTIAPLVDKGAMSIRSAYERWDRLKAEKLRTHCGLRIEQADGGDQCVMLQSVK